MKCNTYNCGSTTIFYICTRIFRVILYLFYELFYICFLMVVMGIRPPVNIFKFVKISASFRRILKVAFFVSKTTQLFNNFHAIYEMLRNSLTNRIFLNNVTLVIIAAIWNVVFASKSIGTFLDVFFKVQNIKR